MFFDDGKKARNTHEWCAPEVAPQRQNLQDLAVADFPWIFPKALRGETVYVPRVAELPVEAQAEKTVMLEQDIRESEERLRAIGNALPDIVFVIEEFGRYLEILTSEANLLFLSAENLKHQTFHDVFPERIAQRAAFRRDDRRFRGDAESVQKRRNGRGN